MKPNRRDVATEQGDYRKRVRCARNWWVIPVVAMLASPTPSWSQFKEPEVTEIRGGGAYDWAPTFSSDMLEVYWMVSYGNSRWDIWAESPREH